MRTTFAIIFAACALTASALPSALDARNLAGLSNLVARDNATMPPAAPKPPSDEELPFFGVAKWSEIDGKTAGACGAVYKNTDAVIAVSQTLYGRIDEVSPMCGVKAWISNANGKCVLATIADVCEGGHSECGGPHAVVLSKGLYTALGGDIDVGHLAVLWGYNV